MFSVLGLFVIVLFGLTVLLWTGALGLQGLIYSEPAAKLYWRGPAAGAALTALIGVWCMMTYSMYADDLRADPDATQLPLDTLFRFQPTQTKTADKFISVIGDKEILYRKYQLAQYKMNSGDASKIESVEYRTDDGRPWTRSNTEGIVSAIIVEDGNQKMRFEPKLAKDKTFLTNAPFPGYYEVNGRHYMETLGRVSIFNRGRWFLNMAFNIAHLGLWFLCLWLLLQFQWPHALGLAVVMWGLMTLVVLPMVFDRMREVAQEKILPRPATPQASRKHDTHCLSRIAGGMKSGCLYPEGVASHSPGLTAQRATLGRPNHAPVYPEGVASTHTVGLMQPLRGRCLDGPGSPG